MKHTIDDLIDAMSHYSVPMPLAELKKAFSDPIPERTLRRWLTKLVNDGSIVASGQHKSKTYQLANVELKPETPTSHPFFSSASLSILERIKLPIFQREPCTYNTLWLTSYIPNQSFYLSESQRKILAKNGVLISEDLSANTYTKKIFNRLLIDLSYNSSRLEGNTYSLIETEKLVIEGNKAADKLDVEQLMILNHKEAIRFLVDGINRIDINLDTIRTMHYLLAEGLILASDAGQIREEPVRVSLTTYAPIEGKERLLHLLENIVTIARKIIDPFEQSFFLLVHISYLQAFIDINKRTARLCANIPLVRNSLAPISFNDIDKEDYISAVLAVYEYNEVGPLAELYTWSYLRSCKQYKIIGNVVGINVIHVRYRSLRRDLIAQIIRERLTGKKLQQFIQNFSEKNIPIIDRSEFIDDAINDIKTLETFKILGMGISQEEFALWKKAQE